MVRTSTFHMDRHEIYGPCPGYLMLGPFSGDVQVHVSYTSDAPVDFWMIETAPPYDAFQIFGCRPPQSGSGIVAAQLGSTSHEFEAIMTSGYWYHLGWLPSHGEGPVMVEYDLELLYQRLNNGFTTEVRYTTISSTQETVFPTQNVRVSSYLAGLGPVFFAGFAVLVAGIALTTVVAAMKTISAPSVAPAESCRQCGARIPRGSKFCGKCGTAALRDQ